VRGAVADQQAGAGRGDAGAGRVVLELIDAGIVEIGDVEVAGAGAGDQREPDEEDEEAAETGEVRGLHGQGPHIAAAIDSHTLRLGGYGATS
jgi:hypothetical protein